MNRLEYVPHGYNEIIEYYGNPDPDHDGNFNTDFWNKYMKKFTLPYPLRIGWEHDNTVSRIWMHELIGDAVVDALMDIGTYISGDPEYLERNGLNMYWGCYAFRFQRGANIYSTHSWGIAIDFNRHLGGLDEEPKQPMWFIDRFVERGFKWGGDWDRPDGMHLQACTGY